jgi:hypothetical protein
VAVWGSAFCIGGVGERGARRPSVSKECLSMGGQYSRLCQTGVPLDARQVQQNMSISGKDGVVATQLSCTVGTECLGLGKM